MGVQILTAEFIRGAMGVEQFPKADMPEIAFWGRSNVGKSSLLNNLVRRKKLALTSQTPGKTREINFFDIENSWIFADLPGLGYAKISKERRSAWSKLTREYLLGRRQLRAVLYLVDSRHDPTAIDMGTIEWLENHERPFVLVLTKIDKISKAMVAEREEQIREFVRYCTFCRDVSPHSAKTSEGRERLLAIIKKLCSQS